MLFDISFLVIIKLRVLKLLWLRIEKYKMKLKGCWFALTLYVSRQQEWVCVVEKVSLKDLHCGAEC